MTERDALCLEYHMKPDRKSSCGSMAIDMANLLDGYLTFSDDGRLMVTQRGRLALVAYRAHATPPLKGE
jgi:hypothetical protein